MTVKERPKISSYNKPMSVNELKAMGKLKVILNTCRGQKNRITGKNLSSMLKEKYGYRIAPPRLRKMINHLTIDGFTYGELIANSTGYWLERNPDKVVNWEETMEGRIFAMQKRLNAVRKHRIERNS